MRALSSLLLCGVVGLGGLVVAPAPAEADGGWRGRNHYRHYAPPPAYYGYGPRAYYGPPRGYYAPPPIYYRPPPPAYYAPPPAFYGGPPGFYGGPRSYGIPPGPGVGLFIR